MWPAKYVIALTFTGLAGCKEEVPFNAMANEGEGEDDGNSKSGLEDQGCPTFDPAELASCCEIGPAHCAPKSAYTSRAVDFAAACGEQGVCVPDELLLQGEGYVASSCTSIGGRPGGCLSRCVPDVEKYQAVLPQDVCRADQRCAPCIDPTNGKPTGACQTLTCLGDVDEGEAEAEGEDPMYSCENPPPEPVIDPSTLPACCEGAHCLSESLVPPDGASMLAPCEGGYCVPDLLLESGGYFTLPSCRSIAGLDGRCLSTCLPAIAEQASNLPQSSCASNERCAPCCDPFAGTETGLCSAGCDTGPETACTGEPAFARCCEDSSGYCLPTSVIPDEGEENLQPCSEGGLCLPGVFLDPAWTPPSCVGSMFIDDYDGVCLPDCLDFGWVGWILDPADCPANYVCAPCTNPLTGEATGAPGCAG